MTGGGGESSSRVDGGDRVVRARPAERKAGHHTAINVPRLGGELLGGTERGNGGGCRSHDDRDDGGCEIHVQGRRPAHGAGGRGDGGESVSSRGGETGGPVNGHDRVVRARPAERKARHHTAIDVPRLGGELLGGTERGNGGGCRSHDDRDDGGCEIHVESCCPAHGTGGRR